MTETVKPSSAARVAAHKRRGKYVCATISREAACALAAIQRHCGGSQREAIEDALLTLAARLPKSDCYGGTP